MFFFRITIDNHKDCFKQLKKKQLPTTLKKSSRVKGNLHRKKRKSATVALEMAQKQLVKQKANIKMELMYLTSKNA